METRRKARREIKAPESSTPTATSARSTEERLAEMEKKLQTVMSENQELLQRLEERDGSTSLRTDTRSEDESGLVPMTTWAKMMSKSKYEEKDLPRFTGYILDWHPFITAYRKTTEAYDISEQVNHRRLRKALGGRALKKVADLLENPCMTNAIIERLEFLYGKSEKLMDEIDYLCRTTPRLRSSLSNLQEFTTEVIKIQMMVQKLNMPELERRTLRQLLPKLPDTQRQTWGIHCRMSGLEKDNDLKEFKEWINTYLLERDELERHDSRESERKRERDDYRERQPPRKEGRYQTWLNNKRRAQTDEGTHRQMMRNDKDTQETRCILDCPEKHQIMECPKFLKESFENKNKILLKNKRCIVCGQKGHFARQCPKHD